MGIVEYANLEKKAIGSRVNCVLCKNLAKNLSKIFENAGLYTWMFKTISGI